LRLASISEETVKFPEPGTGVITQGAPAGDVRGSRASQRLTPAPDHVLRKSGDPVPSKSATTEYAHWLHPGGRSMELVNMGFCAPSAAAIAAITATVATKLGKAWRREVPDGCALELPMTILDDAD
jgi:hypothetical protein